MSDLDALFNENKGPDWRKTIRCQSCASYFPAQLAKDFELITVDNDLERDWSYRSMFLISGECPNCHALHTIEFNCN